MRELTKEERMTVLRESREAYMRGDIAESNRIIMENIPLTPSLAWAIKQVGGKEHLLSLGFDLSKAEAAYGKDWLDRP